MEYFSHAKAIQDTVDLYIRGTKKDTRIIVDISLCIINVTYERIRISLRNLYECCTITYKKTQQAVYDIDILIRILWELCFIVISCLLYNEQKRYLEERNIKTNC